MAELQFIIPLAVTNHNLPDKYTTYAPVAYLVDTHMIKSYRPTGMY